MQSQREFEERMRSMSINSRWGDAAEPVPKPAPTIMEYINELKRLGQWRYDLEIPVRPGEFVEYTSNNRGTVYMLIKDGSGYITKSRVVGGPGSSGHQILLK